MRFAQREYLLALAVLLPLVVGLLVLAWRARVHALARFGNLALVRRMAEATSRDRQRFKMVLLVAAMIFLLLALARPQWGSEQRNVARSGIDIVIAIDVSRSMLAEDMGGRGRLDKALEEVGALIDHARGDRIGLVAFAGKAEEIAPLTLHYGALKVFLNDLSPYTISLGGTALAEAIRVSTNAFVQTERKYKAMILITDGEETVATREDVLEAARAAFEEGVRIYTVGIGTAGTPIPIIEEDGSVEFVRDRQGQIVYSKPDEELLRRVALIADGRYYRAATDGLELERIYAELDRLEEKQLRDSFQVHYVDRFHYFIALALLCLVWEQLMSERRRGAGRTLP